MNFATIQRDGGCEAGNQQLPSAQERQEKFIQ